VTDTVVTLPPPGERGRLDIRNDVVETIARLAAAGESQTYRATGVSRLVGSDLPRARVSVHAGQVRVTMTVAAPWPTPVAVLAERVQAAVTRQVHDYTGLTVTSVDVDVRCTARDDQPARRVL
jgi:uncharacterized alkaline shock family protein YloU